MAVDAGFAREFLSDLGSERIMETFGVSLFGHRMVLNVIMLFEPLAILTLVGLGVLLYGLLGLFILLIAPLLVWQSWRSAQIPRFRGWLPKTLMAVFALYAAAGLFEGLSAPHVLAGVTGFFLFGAAMLKYEYPTWQTVRIVRRHPEAIPALVDAHVVALCTAEEAARWRAKADGA